MITAQPRTSPADPYSIELTYTHRHHWAGNAEDGPASSSTRNPSSARPPA